MFAKSHKKDVKVRRLRLLMWAFLLAMAVPSIVLVSKSYDQLKWEAYYQHRLLAEGLAKRVDQQLNRLMLQEQERSFGDYGFVVVESNLKTNYLGRSPLSSYPIESEIPGLVGYFQIDPKGQFSTPLSPRPTTIAAQYGISDVELQSRLGAEQALQQILSSNDLLSPKQEPEVAVTANRQKTLSDDRKGLLESFSSSISKEQRSGVSASAPASLDEGYDQAGDLAVEPELSKPRPTQQPEAVSQSAFDEISIQNAVPAKSRKQSKPQEGSLGRIEELELESPYAEQVVKREDEKKARSKKDLALNQKAARAKKVAKRKITLEAGVVAEEAAEQLSDLSSRDADITDSANIRIFENEIDPIELTLLSSGHLVFFRKVWRDGQRYIQGILVEQEAFLSSVFQQEFSRSLIANMSNMAVVYQGNVLSAYGNTGRNYRLSTTSGLNGTLLYRSRLSAPFEDLEGVYTIRNLPAGTGGNVIWWASWILALVLSLGTYLLYRLSLRNINMVSQQQDFVSAVSHELKTPLTSIRMYGEILKSGWADEDKKKGYYSFIFDESERLTRLINNVLALARMTHNETRANMQRTTVAELIDVIHSKVDSQLDAAGFELSVSVDSQVESASLLIDPDLFTQIMINLVDNALKFSAKAEQKSIEINVSPQSSNRVLFKVRDFGPGIEKDQMKKIFELFYRSENELTRETTGTGIGLALVSQLIQLMKGKIDVVNCEPGAEFRLTFDCALKH